MSGIVKVNKSGLDSASTTLVSRVSDYDSSVSSMSSTLASIPEHGDFPNLTSKASMLSRGLSNIGLDLNHVSKNIKTYIDTLIEIDSEGFEVKQQSNNNNNNSNDQIFNTSSDNGSSSVYNNVTTWSTVAGAYSGVVSGGANSTYSYSTGPSGTTNNGFQSSTLSSSDYNVQAGGKYNYEGIEEYIEDREGVTVTLPEGLGNIHTYMGWQCITAKSSRQYKLREAAGMNFDEEGFAKIGDRYVVATTTTFGNVGDFIDVYQEDGTVIKCIIGDIKSQGDAGCTKWGHNNGRCVVEFVVDKRTWYSNGGGAHSNPGTSSCHPEWNQNIDKIVNKGNFFELIKTDAAKFETFSTATDVSDNFVNKALKELDNTDSSVYTEMFGNSTSGSWDSEFVTYVADKCGYVSAGVIPKFDEATDGVDWFRDKNSFKTPDYEPKSGDIVFYDLNGDGKADHTGIVTGFANSQISTIEGGIDNTVKKYTYKANDAKIVGYGVPDYAAFLLAQEDEKKESN